MGVAEPDRLGVMGWSYGGFMTPWVTTRIRHLKAASIGAPVTSLMRFTGTTDIPSFIPDYMGAEFWDDLELLDLRLHAARSIRRDLDGRWRGWAKDQDRDQDRPRGNQQMLPELI